MRFSHHHQQMLLLSHCCFCAMKTKRHKTILPVAIVHGCRAMRFNAEWCKNKYILFNTAVLHKTPVFGNFTTFKAAHVEKKKFKPVTRSKISILFRTLGSEVYHLYSGTQYRGKAVVRSLSSFKSFHFSIFL